MWCSDAPKVSPGEAVEQNTKGKGPLCGPIPVPILFMAEVKMQLCDESDVSKMQLVHAGRHSLSLNSVSGG